MAERGRPRSFDRDAALARAMEVFWAKGYEAASITDLTSAMGVAAPSLYAAFGSKEALFREAVDLYGAIEGPAVAGGIETSPTAREAVEGYLMATARAFSRPDKPRGCLVMLSALSEAGAGPSVAAEMRSRRAGVLARLQARIERAKAEDELPAGLDARALAAYVLTVQQGMSIQARDGAGYEALAAIAHAAMAAWEPLTEAAGAHAA